MDGHTFDCRCTRDSGRQLVLAVNLDGEHKGVENKQQHYNGTLYVHVHNKVVVLQTVRETKAEYNKSSGVCKLN